MKKVLLFRWGSLGDVLITFPSIYLLRKKMASSSITLVCRKEYGTLLQEIGVIDKVLPSDDRKLLAFFSYPENKRQTNKKWIKDYSLFLGWFQNKKSVETLKSGFLKNKNCYFFIYDSSCKEPLSNFFFKQTAKTLEKKESSLLFFNHCSLLPLTSRHKKEGLNLLPSQFLKEGSSLVVVHPGSGSLKKCWPFHNYIQIIKMLDQKGYRGVLLTGPAEERMEHKIQSLSLPSSWLWLRNPPLFKLSGLLSQANLYLGNDSGITHLAASCGTKVIALFLHKYEAEWRPLGRAFIISGESMEEIDVYSVWKVINKVVNLNQ